MKGTFPMYVLQSRRRHLSFVQNFISSLNIPSESSLLISLGIHSHVLGASKDMLPEVYCTV